MWATKKRRGLTGPSAFSRTHLHGWKACRCQAHSFVLYGSISCNPQDNPLEATASIFLAEEGLVRLSKRIKFPKTVSGRTRVPPMLSPEAGLNTTAYTPSIHISFPTPLEASWDPQLFLHLAFCPGMRSPLRAAERSRDARQVDGQS